MYSTFLISYTCTHLVSYSLKSSHLSAMACRDSWYSNNNTFIYDWENSENPPNTTHHTPTPTPYVPFFIQLHIFQKVLHLLHVHNGFLNSSRRLKRAKIHFILHVSFHILPDELKFAITGSSDRMCVYCVSLPSCMHTHLSWSCNFWGYCRVGQIAHCRTNCTL